MTVKGEIYNIEYDNACKEVREITGPESTRRSAEIHSGVNLPQQTHIKMQHVVVQRLNQSKVIKKRTCTFYKSNLPSFGEMQ